MNNLILGGNIMIHKEYSLSIIFLIIANLVPAIGALLLNWNVFEIVFIYWCESGIIGFFFILKTLIATKPIFSGVFLSLFFTIHFGGFMFIHLLFISKLFGKGQALINSVYPILYSLIPLFISHLASFLYNFIGKKEYLKDTIGSINFLSPYKRIFIMDFVIIFGGMLVTLFNQPVIGLILLIILKIIVDINAHVKSHTGKKILN